MHDDQAALIEQLKTARLDAQGQREMKVKAREQRDRVTSLLTQSFNLLMAIRDARKEDNLATWDEREFDAHIDRFIESYYNRAYIPVTQQSTDEKVSDE